MFNISLLGGAKADGSNVARFCFMINPQQLVDYKKNAHRSER